MGRRSRKRAQAGERRSEPTSRAQRDAARQERVERVTRGERPGRRGDRERPPAPWGKFPLSELIVLLALVLLGWGALTYQNDRGKLMVAFGLGLAGLVGLELSIREHFAGYRSHTTLLSATAAIVVTAGAALAGLRQQPVLLAAGVLIFGLCFWMLRGTFQRRSGGLSFR